MNAFKAGTVINEEMLRESKLIRGNVAGLKVLGSGELKHGLTIEADKVSASAHEKIEKAGGTVTLRQRPSLVDGKRSEKKQETPTQRWPKRKRRRRKPRRRKRKRLNRQKV